MARIIIVSTSEKSRLQLSGLLASSGYGVFRVCASASELRRTLTACEDGIVIVAGSVPECSPDDLVGDFGDGFHVLLVGRPDALNACESPRVFKLAYPCAGSAVIGAVEMLSQLHAMGLPRRAGEDRALIDRAKLILMRRQGISEPEAHRQMQLYAMRHSMRMTDYARALLREGE